MAYTPQTWVDGVSGGTPISAVRLTHIEAGITAAASNADNAVTGLSTVTVTSISITDATSIGKSVLTAVDASAVRTAIGAGTYSLPGGGAPATDLASAVQTSLGKADSALQSAPVATVAGRTGAIVLTADDTPDGSTNKAYTATDKTRLAVTSGTNTGDQTSVTGNAGTATKLATSRTINGVSFDGSANITIADSTKYTKPGPGIPSSDMTAIVQAILVKADTLGVRKSGTTGGVAAALSRRSLPNPATADSLTTLTVTETVTVNTQTTTIASGAGVMFMLSGKAAYPGGNGTPIADGVQASAFRYGWKYPNNSSFPNPGSWSAQFWITGSQQIEFLVYARPSASWNLIVDDKPVYDIPRITTITSNAFNLVKFDLGDTNLHRIRFEMNNLSLKTVFAAPGATAWLASLRGPRTFFLGDSTTQGAGQSTGGELGSWINRFSRLTGIEDVWNGGIGSTGPVNDNGGTSANYVTRATTDAVPSNADIVFVCSYYNDKDTSTATVAAAYTSAITALRTMTVSPQIYVIGAYDPLGSNGAPYTAMDTAIKAVCTTAGVPYIEPSTGNVYDGTGAMILPNTGAGPWITSGNKAAFIGGDNIHQTDAGQKYYAYRMYESLRALLPA